MNSADDETSPSVPAPVTAVSHKPLRRRGSRRRRNGETAGSHLTANVPRALVSETAAQILKRLGRRRFEYAGLVCVTDEEDRLVGAIALADLIALPPGTVIAEAVQPVAPVLVDEDQEKLASIALHRYLHALPVIDRGERFLGVVPPFALMNILRHEHVEDLHRLAGIKKETRRAREAMESAPTRRARDRLPWLVIGLIGSAIATHVVGQFHQELEQRVAIAFFIPGLVYMADAIGTQTEAIAVRGLSLSHANLRHLLGGEVRTGLLIGLVLALLTFPAVWLIFRDYRLALAVAGALFCAGCVATAVGLLLPWLLGQLGSDPAYGSGPLATIIQDVLSLLIYFAIADVLLF